MWRPSASICSPRGATCRWRHSSSPRQFDEYRDYGLSLGFKAVFSGPLVRSSYMADEVSEEARTAVVLNWALALASAALLILTFPRFRPGMAGAGRAGAAAGGGGARAAAGGAASCWAGARASSTGSASATGSSSCWRSTAGWATRPGGRCSCCSAWPRRCTLGVFALLAGILMRRWWAVPAVAALWVAVEVTHGPLGFAWLALGNAGIDMGIPLRLAPFTGVYGLSFVFAMMAAALALAVLRRPRLELLWLLPLPLLRSAAADCRERERGRETALLRAAEHLRDRAVDAQSRSIAMERRPGDALAARRARRSPSSRPRSSCGRRCRRRSTTTRTRAFRGYVDNLARTAHAYFLLGHGGAYARRARR